MNHDPTHAVDDATKKSWRRHDFLHGCGGCLSILIIVVVILPSIFVWADDRPDTTTWILRFVVPGSGLIASAYLFWRGMRPDRAPNYLVQLVGRDFFDKDGFWFTFGFPVTKHVCHLEIWFQNNGDRPARARIALRPSAFDKAKWPFQILKVEIHADAGAFGVARMPVPIPTYAQGMKHELMVGATIERPSGPWASLRKGNGIQVTTEESFWDIGGTALTIAALATGSLYFRTGPSISVVFPSEVAMEVPHVETVDMQTFWRLGDPPVELESLLPEWMRPDGGDGAPALFSK